MTWSHDDIVENQEHFEEIWEHEKQICTRYDICLVATAQSKYIRNERE